METDSGQEGGRGIRWRIARVATKEQQRESPNAMSGPTVTITWEKFRRTVLGSARKIEFYVPGKEECYTAILTAEDQEAPPIILWDTEENRNPFSWYVYSGGSTPSRWNLLRGYVEVTGVTLQPNLWQPGYEHRGASVIFILMVQRTGTVGVPASPCSRRC